MIWVENIEGNVRDLRLEVTLTERATDRIGWRGKIVVALSSRVLYGQ